MPKRSSKRRDLNELARAITDRATGERAPEPEEAPVDTSGKNPAAVALGRLGGKKGGRARAEKLTSERRQEIAKKAAQSRWSRHKAHQ
jgi:hypothetical protein